MPSSSTKATPEFQYPPVQADRSLTSLDLNTLMMKSTTRRLPEEPGSSLDDSTYEMLTDSLIEISDDEAHTESIASTSDAPTPDDVSAFSDDDDDFESGERALDASIQSMHAAAEDDDLETPLAPGGEDSMLTMVPDNMDGSGRSSMILLDEESTESANAALGSAILKTLPTQREGLPKVLECYGRAQIRLVVKAGLSPRHMPTPESYKILYLGLPERWVQDNITSHIHAALTASPSNTRSVMVRGQMEPLGPVVHAYRCAQLEVHDADAVLPDLLIRTDDGERLKINRHKASRFDLVVFCHTERDAAADPRAFDSVRATLRKHKIPMIELSDIHPYGAGTPTSTYNMRSLAACIEGRDDDEADFELLETLPPDAYTFCGLEPAQVNRHLALISPHLMPSSVEVAQKSRISHVGDTMRAVGKQLRTGAPATTKVMLLSFALVAVLSAFVLSPVLMPLMLQKPTEVVVEAPALSVVPESSSLITPPAVSSTSIASVPSPSSPSVSVPKGLTVIAPQAKQLKPKQDKKKDEKLNGFDIQTAGEKQFVLTPSKELASSRKKPQLQIQVFRNTTSVPVRYVRTITGEYFVDLAEEYPFGKFNVCIASYSKPLLRQSFEVSLGHNKTWFDQMLGMATSKAANAQTLLSDVSSSAMRQLHERLDSIAGTKLGRWVEDGRHLEELAYRNTKEGLESGAEIIKHVPEATWMGLRRATAPMRLSQTMWKARMNALRMRCDAETAVGSLLKLSHGQSSRACSELQAHAHKRVGRT